MVIVGAGGLVVAGFHINIGTHPQGFGVVRLNVQHEGIIHPRRLRLAQLQIEGSPVQEDGHIARGKIQRIGVRLQGRAQLSAETLHGAQIGKEECVSPVGGVQAKGGADGRFGRIETIALDGRGGTFAQLFVGLRSGRQRKEHGQREGKKQSFHQHKSV